MSTPPSRICSNPISCRSDLRIIIAFSDVVKMALGRKWAVGWALESWPVFWWVWGMKESVFSFKWEGIRQSYRDIVVEWLFLHSVNKWLKQKAMKGSSKGKRLIVCLAARWWNDLKAKVKVFHFVQNARTPQYIVLSHLGLSNRGSPYCCHRYSCKFTSVPSKSSYICHDGERLWRAELGNGEPGKNFEDRINMMRAMF